jgi:hypothetical protein
MRQVTAKAKKGGGKMKTSEVRVKPLSNGSFLVAHHQEPEQDMTGPGMGYTPRPDPVETGHKNWKDARKHIDGIFGAGSGAGGATADAANAPMPAQTPDAEPSGGAGQQ